MIQEKIGFCEDCGQENNLIEVEACCNDIFRKNKCCTKFICTDGCVFQCKYCLEEIYESDFDRDSKFTGFINIFNCPNCKSENCILFDWYGNSPKKERSYFMFKLLQSDLIDITVKELLITSI
jgi:hypothetical protein